MRMTDEQFINEVYRRRDGEIKKRISRRKTILSVVPVVVVVTLATALFSLRGFDKSVEMENGAAQDNAAEKKAIYYDSDNSPVNLDDQASRWLLNNAVLDEDEDDIGSVQDGGGGFVSADDTQDKEISDETTTPAQKAETGASGLRGYSSATKGDAKKEPAGTVIELSLGSETHRFILNEKGLYSCENKSYLPITQGELDVLRGFIK